MLRLSKKERTKNRRVTHLILALILFLGAYGLFSILTFSKWDGSRRISIVINSNPLIVFSVEPASKQGVLLAIPANAILDVPYGYGPYLASSVYRLGLLDGKRNAGELLAKSIENTLGIATEGYITSKSKDSLFVFPQPVSDKAFADFRNKYFSFSGLIFSFGKVTGTVSQFNTNLAILDLFRLWNTIRVIRSDNIAILALSESQVISEEKDEDGKVVVKIDKELFDAFISDHFQDAQIRTENITIEVVNAVDSQGLAGQFGRIIANLGGNVIIKTTAEKKEDYRCMIFASQKKYLASYLVLRLKNLYQCRVNELIDSKSHADIQIVLGKEFIQ